jgi:hypothetical protein
MVARIEIAEAVESTSRADITGSTTATGRAAR